MTDGELLFFAFKAGSDDPAKLDPARSLQNSLPADIFSLLQAASRRMLERTEPDCESFTIGHTSTYEPAAFSKTQVPMSFVRQLAGMKEK
jgi:hypothetical protein